MRKREAVTLEKYASDVTLKNHKLAERNLYLAKKNVLLSHKLKITKALLKDARPYVEWVALFMTNEDAKLLDQKVEASLRDQI